MLRNHSVFKTKLQQVAPRAFMIHLMIYRDAQAGGSMPDNLLNFS